jgi:prolyl-tRNA synthetase
MRLSQYYLPLIKETPSEAKIASHKLMLKSGMIKQISSGIYAWLPLGLKVLQNIEEVIRQNMKEVGMQELLMPCVQPAGLWRQSGRYEDYGKEMLCFGDRHDNELLFGPTHEEVITEIFSNTVHSYKKLPTYLYQMQWKFRDEIRPRFGVMRGREFYMKDGYSFDLTEEEAENTYYLMYKAYLKIFKQLGVPAVPVVADTGAIGGSLSHEFHVLADTGESKLYYDKRLEEMKNSPDKYHQEMLELYAKEEEKHKPEECNISQEELAEKRGIEVGQIFYFGTKYSESLKAYVNDKDGNQIAAKMGSYGIGISRLVGAIIESSHDERGIIWPPEVAPFKVSIINIKPGNPEIDEFCEHLYKKLEANFGGVLYDDTLETPGSKFASNDLIGTPYQVIIGPKDFNNNLVELKSRSQNSSSYVEIAGLEKKLQELLN